MTLKEQVELRELAECSGMVRDDQYSADERKIMRSLERQGYVMLAWVLTAKGKAEIGRKDVSA